MRVVVPARVLVRSRSGRTQPAEERAGRPTDTAEADDGGGHDRDRPGQPPRTSRQARAHTTTAPSTAQTITQTTASAVSRTAVRC